MKSIKIILVAVAFAGFIGGCKSFTKGYDVNPLAPSDAPSTSLFVSAQGAFDEFMEGYPAQMASMWAQQVTGSDRQFTGYYNYNTSAQDYQNDWATAYTGVLENLRLVETKAASAGQLNLVGAAKILEGIQMGTVAALWGDVPYSQAAQPSVTLTPKFDRQDSVYAEVQATLDAGIATLSANKTVLPVDIFSSNGDPNAWLRAAHTAKARYLMHVARHAGYSSSILNQVISEAQQGILDLKGAQDWIMPHKSGTYNGDMNLWYSFMVYDRSGYMDASKNFVLPMIKALARDGKTNDSGRAAYYYSANGKDLNTSSGGAYSATSSYPFFRASETYLLMAEAYARLGDQANAIANLNNARQYNDNVFGDKSLPYTAADFPNSNALLQAIFNEEYLSLMHQVEVFNFLRRINFQIQYQDSSGNTVKLTPTVGTQFPQRFFYPTNELTANPNTPPQVTADLFKPTLVNTP